MPIRAILDSHIELQVPMPEKDWRSLRRQLKRNPMSLRLPCCGVRAIPKKSRRGTQHFAHFRHGECDWEPEGEEHLAAKFQIRDGIRKAGWTAIPEYAGPGWRADVAATDGKVFKAFEVQWSPQTLEKTLERHERYQASSVPAFWLFRNLPHRHNQRPRDAFDWYVWEDFTAEALPFFALETSDDKFRVGFNRYHTSLPLTRFSELVASGKFQWRPAVSVARMWVYFCSALSNCYRCGSEVRSVEVSRAKYLSVCGLKVDSFREGERLVVPQKHFGLVQKFLQGEGARLDCKLVMWSENGEEPQGWYLCPHCRTRAVSDSPRFHERSYRIRVDTKGREISYAHWCVGGSHGLCSENMNAPKPESWLQL
jgi:hypothetical protein